jgi:catechol 2,3-dioxygenase-like lactoylglutathione lyase family enzyme
MNEPQNVPPLPETKRPALDLFMTVIKVADWSGAVAWYSNTLELEVVLQDAEHQFALLATGSGRLGIQGTFQALPPSGRVRLVFQVEDVDETRRRLLERGVSVGPPVDNHRENYREVRLRDPEGISLTLFSWTERSRDAGSRSF